MLVVRMVLIELSTAFAEVCELESGLAWKQEGEGETSKYFCLHELSYRFRRQAWCCVHASRGCLYDCEASLGRCRGGQPLPLLF